ncbi:MAG: methenyltetrahydromethanopterin cyclohydrolase [Planctomycetes bacterium]|nr:methenyltetrahydromethanopterin cyclohydrolase [Planctomycetota bacterium]
MNLELNDLASQLIEDVTDGPEDLRIAQVDLPGNGLLLDFGIETEGGLEAGCALASICMSGLADIGIVPGLLGDIGWQQVVVQTDSPVAACLFSQYAGWQVNVGKFFAMGSGPMRAVVAKEPLFDKLWYREVAEQVVGILETARLPGPDVFEYIAQEAGVEPDNVVLCVAPTSSMAGNLQVVARSVETALHKLYELGFDVNRVRSGVGSAPLPPVARNDMEGIGRTNDAILYGGRVTLWVNGDDESISDIVKRVPSSSSASYGSPFLDIFEAAGRDFYKIDPLLFSPAEIVIQNVDSGRVHVAGRVNVDVLKRSFGI